MPEDKAKLLDEYMVASACAGDRDALAQLVRIWHPKLVAHGIRLTGNREMARDAVQNGWAEIIRGLRNLRDHGAFSAWAYRIVSRACAKEIGKSVRRRELKTAILAEPPPQPEALQEPSERDRLQAAIRQLPAGERAAIALYHFEEMRVAEVAVALAVPAGTVKTRLMNARKKLRAILEGET